MRPQTKILTYTIGFISCVGLVGALKIPAAIAMAIVLGAAYAAPRYWRTSLPVVVDTGTHIIDHLFCQSVGFSAAFILVGLWAWAYSLAFAIGLGLTFLIPFTASVLAVLPQAMATRR